MTIADQISAFVDRDFARETAFLAELVKVPSDNPPGDCAAHAARAMALLEQLGLSVEAHPVPRSTVEAAGMKSATNLIVRHRFGDGPTVALNAHGDVVPPGRGWTRDPYGAVVEDGPHGKVMYGRGAAVSKSDFATYTFALLALKDAAANGAKLGGTVELHFTYDEESGGDIGPKLIARRGTDEAGLCDRRRLLLCDRQRPQWLPAPRGHRRRQAGARGHPRQRRRCAGSSQCDPRGALCQPAIARQDTFARRPASRRRRSTSD